MMVNFDLGIKLNAKELVGKAPCIFGHAHVSGMCKLLFPRITIMIPKNGTCKLMGAESSTHVLFSIWSFLFVLQKIGYFGLYPQHVAVEGIMANCRLPFPIKARTLYETNPRSPQNPDGYTLSEKKFPGCRIKKGRVGVTIFRTGLINTTGARTYDTLHTILQTIVDDVFPHCSSGSEEPPEKEEPHTKRRKET
jgi:TATA-box binding protein (TBP) (component of TFIID and TFIIIB)